MSTAEQLPQPGITVRAPAKINLRLEVGPVRDDGYHPLATVYQAIGIYDDVHVVEQDHWSIHLEPDPRIDLSDVPLDQRNLAWRAGEALTALHGIDRCALITITKQIPVEGGMAGGSADAAATLVALDRLWDLQTSDDDLLRIAADLGSDVPFALLGGSAFGGGRGEVVTPLADSGNWWWVVIENDRGLSTPAVYAEFDRLAAQRGERSVWQQRHSVDPNSIHSAPKAIDAALESGDIEGLAGELVNDLQAAALNLRPDLQAALDAGQEAGALASVISGSGPTVVHLLDTAASAQLLRGSLIERGFERVRVAPGPVAGATLVEYDG